MRHEVAVVVPGAPIGYVTELMAERGLEGVAVVDGRGRVVGTVSDEQLVRRLNARRARPWWRKLAADGDEPDGNAGDVTAGEAMLRRVVTTSPALLVTAAIRLFDEHAVNMLPVIDHGRLVGVVYRGDLVRQLLVGKGRGGYLPDGSWVD